jgi:hypothetical protein
LLVVVYSGILKFNKNVDISTGVAELADAHDSKSCSSRSVGSTPTTGILSQGEILDTEDFQQFMLEVFFLLFSTD